METIFQDLVDEFGDTNDLVDIFALEVKTLSLENDSIMKKNVGLKNQLKYSKYVFYIVVTEHS